MITKLNQKKKGQVWFQYTQPISRRNRSAADELTTGLVLFPEFFSSKPFFPKKKKSQLSSNVGVALFRWNSSRRYGV